MSRVYCMASAKGGSGKTVLCASFAAFLSSIGKKVLLVDVDPATHGLTLLYINEVRRHGDSVQGDFDERPQGLFDGTGFSRERDVVQLGRVCFLPATFDFRVDEDLHPATLREILQHVVATARQEFDYILLDAQAGSDDLSVVAFHRDIADEVIIVSEYDPMSAAGVERLKALYRDDLTFDRTWILVNKMLPEFVDTFSSFMEISRYLSPIPWDADVVRAYARRALPLDLEYGNTFTLAVMQALTGLLGDAERAELDAWAADRASMIREPIDRQYADMEAELGALMLLSREKERRSHLRMTLNAVLSTAFAAIGFSLLKTVHADYSLWGLAFLLPMIAFGVKMILEARSDSNVDVEQARTARRRRVLEEELTQLEMLNKASYEELVKARRSSAS